MSNHEVTVVFVSFMTPELVKILIDSFKKFCTEDFTLKFLAIENSDYDLKNFLKDKNCIVINRSTNSELSYAHSEGLEASKNFVDTEYVFTCHSDVCVTSSSFFWELKKCIDDDVSLAGVCEDAHPDRVRALHCSGLFMKTELFKKVSTVPELPVLDTADKYTVYCRDNNLKMRRYRNTYNDTSIVEVCNSPFKELGPTCGMDRCLDSNDKVMFIHQGRGTTKHSGKYHNYGKIKTDEWLAICNRILLA